MVEMYIENIVEGLLMELIDRVKYHKKSRRKSCLLTYRFEDKEMLLEFLDYKHNNRIVLFPCNLLHPNDILLGILFEEHHYKLHH